MWVGGWKVPSWLRGLMPVVIIPLIASLIASGLLLLVLGGPIAALTLALNDWLSGLTGVAAIGLGVILGLMMGADLGGPINKVAYAFAVAGLGEGAFDNQAPWQIMAAVMAAGMVPPLGMALATVLDKSQFSMALRENGKAAWLLGAAFISEGAIPFAAADPLRVIPSTMLGGAVAGAICMAAGVTSQAPHGGIFVFFAIGNVLYVHRGHPGRYGRQRTGPRWAQAAHRIEEGGGTRCCLGIRFWFTGRFSDAHHQGNRSQSRPGPWAFSPDASARSRARRRLQVRTGELRRRRKRPA